MPRSPSRSSASDAAPWLQAVADGAVLHLHVCPGASSAGLTGLHGGALRVRLRARPVEGAANRELLAVLSDLLGIRAADLRLEAGASGRAKRVRVAGLPAATVRARIEAALSVDPRKRHD